MAVIGAARCFESPTVAALLPGVVAPGRLPAALALSASAMQTATIVGPALGGASIFSEPAGPMRPSRCFSGRQPAGRRHRDRRVPPPREPVSLSSLLSGFVYIRDHPMVLGAISLDLFAVLLGGATALLPVYAQDILHTTPIGLGLLRGAPAVGALLTSLVLARHPLRHHVGMKMFAAVAIFGVATMLFGLSTSFPLSLAALVVLGASDVVSVVVRGSLVQIATPDAMRGRVSAVNRCSSAPRTSSANSNRHHGRAVRHRAGRGDRRRRHDRGGAALVAAVPVAAARAEPELSDGGLDRTAPGREPSRREAVLRSMLRRWR